MFKKTRKCSIADMYYYYVTSGHQRLERNKRNEEVWGHYRAICVERHVANLKQRSDIMNRYCVVLLLAMHPILLSHQKDSNETHNKKWRSQSCLWPGPCAFAVPLGLVHLLIHSLSHNSSISLFKHVLINMQITKIFPSMCAIVEITIFEIKDLPTVFPLMYYFCS